MTVVRRLPMESGAILFVQFSAAPWNKLCSGRIGEMRRANTNLFTVDHIVLTQTGARLHNGIK